MQNAKDYDVDNTGARNVIFHLTDQDTCQLVTKLSAVSS